MGEKKGRKEGREEGEKGGGSTNRMKEGRCPDVNQPTQLPQ